MSSVGVEGQEVVAQGVGRSPRVRVLHLVRPATNDQPPLLSLRPRRWSEGWTRTSGGSDVGLLACREIIRGTPQHQHRTVVYGGNTAGHRAAAFGLDAAARISSPFSRPELGVAGLKNLIADDAPPDIIQCWDGSFGVLRDRMALTTTGSVWLVADMNLGVLEVRDAMSGAGEPLTNAVTPWLPASPRISAQARRAGRERLGARDDEVLVAMVGDPPMLVDAMPVVYAASILHVAGVRVVPVLMRGAVNLTRALRYVREGGYVRRVVVMDEPSLLTVAACDVGMCIPAAASMGDTSGDPALGIQLSVARASAQGLPVLVKRAGWIESLLPEEAASRLPKDHDHASLARAVFSLLEDGRAGHRAWSGALLEKGLRAPGRGIVEEVSGAWDAALARAARQS